MLRPGGFATSCACAWLGLGALPAVAMTSGTVATARVADRLAAIIRRDARQAERSKNDVTVVRRCCGTRALRIHYRVKHSGSIVAGTYVLRLETTRAGVQGVGVFESVSELDRGLGTSGKSTWGFAFVIHHEPRGPNGGWTYGGSYEDGESGGESNGASFGASSLRACRLPRPVPTVLYREVLGLLTSALRHESAHPSAAALC
jgi:hypothetical protein